MRKGKKITGGRYHKPRKKKFFEKTRQERTVFVGETRKKKIRERGGSVRTTLALENHANVKTAKGVKRVEITNVLDTPQNTFLARQNRIAKSVIIETPLGKARITNRPSREGSVNAVLIEEKE